MVSNLGEAHLKWKRRVAIHRHQQRVGITIKSNASNTEFTAAINMTSTSVGFLASDPQGAPAPAGFPAPIR